MIMMMTMTMMINISRKLLTFVVVVIVVSVSSNNSHNGVVIAQQQQQQQQDASLCTGMCPPGFFIESPDKILNPQSGMTCQMANDRNIGGPSTSPGCSKVKSIADICGCLPLEAGTMNNNNNMTNATSSIGERNPPDASSSSSSSQPDRMGKPVKKFSSSWKEKQKQAVRKVTHVTGMLSFLGSLFVMQDILRDKEKRKRTCTKLICAMSMIDMFSSFALFLGFWPKAQTPGTVANGLPIYGTTGSCTFQGFFIQLGISVPLLNVCLSIYYLLVLKYRWTNTKIVAVEKYLLGIPIAFGLGTAIAGLPLTLYNISGVWCHISGMPFVCEGNESQIPCRRGDHAAILRWVFYYGPLWVAIIGTTLVMSSVTYHVWKEEKSSRRWRGPNAKGDKMSKLSSQVFWQSICYVSVFYLTWIFPTIFRLLQSLDKEKDFSSWWLPFLTGFFMPLQGFFNFFIYLRPRYLKHYREMDETFWKSIRTSVFHRISSTVRDSTSRMSQSVSASVRALFLNNMAAEAEAAAEACKEEVSSTDEEPTSPAEDEETDADVIDPAYVLSKFFINVVTEEPDDEEQAGETSKRNYYGEEGKEADDQNQNNESGTSTDE